VNQENTLPHFKVGDYVKIVTVGIVYEDGSLGKSGAKMRLQKADGTKVRDVPITDVVAATPKEIKQFKAEAVPGITPKEIIAREKKETEAFSGDLGVDEEGEPDEDD
jgi:hypothetical protein